VAAQPLCVFVRFEYDACVVKDEGFASEEVWVLKMKNFSNETADGTLRSR
jgi:hypothetical protein